jgi:hypothetical protein
MNASQVTSRQRGSASASERKSSASLARPRRSGKARSRNHAEPPLARPLRRPRPRRQTQTARELAQKLEQWQVGPRRRLQPVRRRLRHSDRSSRHRRAQHRLELTKGGLPLHDPAQVVLIEVEKKRSHRTRTPECPDPHSHPRPWPSSAVSGSLSMAVPKLRHGTAVEREAGKLDLLRTPGPR